MVKVILERLRMWRRKRKFLSLSRHDQIIVLWIMGPDAIEHSWFDEGRNP